MQSKQKELLLELVKTGSITVDLLTASRPMITALRSLIAQNTIKPNVPTKVTFTTPIKVIKIVKTLNATNFDDLVEDDDGSFWAYLCEYHESSFDVDGTISDSAIECICGVDGCSNIADYLVDLN